MNFKKITLVIVGLGAIAALSAIFYQNYFNQPFSERLKSIAVLIKESDLIQAQNMIAKIDLKKITDITPKERAEFLLYKSKVELQSFIISPQAKDIAGMTVLNKIKNQLKFARAFLMPDLSPKFIELNTQFEEEESLISKLEQELISLNTQQNRNFQNMFNNIHQSSQKHQK